MPVTGLSELLVAAKLTVSTWPILSVIEAAGLTVQGSALSTLLSKRTVISRAMTPLGLPVAVWVVPP